MPLSYKRSLIWLSVLVLSACQTVDVFEKNVSIPAHEWSSSFKPEIELEITDTTSLYNIYFVVRHTDAYRYKNMWVNVYTYMPADSLPKQRLDLLLATDDRGWLGSGMDDIFEHRIRITGEPVQLRKAGMYRFRLEQIMREDPLQDVMNVGIRVEKVKR
ncbi:MAG: gliding motility lipoprotein GldH [Chitinophagaceae bacterium]|nr:gliding motility lipoprotein GldH [Chitinophagaceae bacterium]